MTQTHSEQTARGEVELKACPKCGDDEPFIDQYSRKANRWSVECGRCSYSNATHETREEAIADWNRLPSLSPADNGALGEAATRFLADFDDGDRADAGIHPLMLMHVNDLRAALPTTTDAVRGEVGLREALEKCWQLLLLVSEMSNTELLEPIADNGMLAMDGIRNAIGNLGLQVEATLHPSPEAPIEGQDVERVARAIEQAQCLGREGPFGGYDYGHNTDFYGPAPVDGRYVIRDFRDPASPDWGKWLHQTNDHDEHERMFKQMTEHHVAAAALAALRAPVERKGEGK